jgi:hypothetical protein
VTINPVSGLVTPIGPFNPGLNNPMVDITFTPSGGLFGIGFYLNLFSINTLTGAATQVGVSGIGGFTFGGALAANPNSGTIFSAPVGASAGLYTFDPTGTATLVATSLTRQSPTA